MSTEYGATTQRSHKNLHNGQQEATEEQITETAQGNCLSTPVINNLILRLNSENQDNEPGSNNETTYYKITSRKFPSLTYAIKEKIATIQGQKRIEMLPKKPSLPNKLWKTIAFSQYINLQEFIYKNLINNIKQANEETVLQAAEGGVIAIKKQKQSTTFDNISEWLLAFKAYMDAVLIIYENCEQELNTYRDHINELCTKYKFSADVESEGKNFDAAATKRTREDWRHNTWATTTWPDGREICINWNRKTCTEDRNCRRVHACITCRKLGHSEKTCFRKYPELRKLGLTNIDSVKNEQPTLNKSSKFKYDAQFKASRAITSSNPLSQEEKTIVKQLPPSQFNVTTPINKIAFDYLIQDHPNCPFIQYIKDGLEYGFRFNFSGKRTTKIQENLKSINIEPTALTNYINSEIAIGRMCGPFTIDDLPCLTFQINPCGLVEKKNTNPKVYRIISHLSAPCGTSINDGIDPTEFTTKYENLNHAISWITQYGRALTFGNRASGGIFCRFADVLTWIATGAQQELNQFLRILKVLNIPYKQSKLEGPYTAITFLGIHIDTNTFSASIPELKKSKIIELLTEWHKKSRPFVQRFIKTLGSTNSSKFHIKMTSPMKTDINWWSNILPKWSGIYVMEDRTWIQPNTQNLYTDASNLGGGAMYSVYFTMFNWSQTIDISKHTIQVHNQANAEAFYAGFCRNTIINDIITKMYMTQIQGNYSVKLEHIAGKDNKDADLLSRNGHKQYRAQNPFARYLHLVIPDEYANLSQTTNKPKNNLPLNEQAATILALVAFYSLARLGELLPKSQQNLAKILTTKTLKFERTGTNTFATIQLPRTKNHKIVERPILIINSTKDDLCPIQALKTYILFRTNPTYAPGKNTLFIKANGELATKSWFIGRLKSLLPDANVAGHSFRAGGATELVL
ncbi:14107_t:CDS:10 [Dentiscutata heterogama]|uniref:14107_t:CDS:1 n=1 Tax=Dentiscutata heterogama TaxID=1316150 RepID=A0ACA9LNN1_9GLOM|nr:14107_t:CDS:10 [Dentiscutata heterogama]